MGYADEMQLPIVRIRSQVRSGGEVRHGVQPIILDQIRIPQEGGPRPPREYGPGHQGNISPGNLPLVCLRPAFASDALFRRGWV